MRKLFVLIHLFICPIAYGYRAISVIQLIPYPQYESKFKYHVLIELKVVGGFYMIEYYYEKKIKFIQPIIIDQKLWMVGYDKNNVILSKEQILIEEDQILLPDE